MPNFCCPINRRYGFGHSAFCDNHPDKGAGFLSYPDGIGDVRFTYRDGSTHTLKRVQFETIGGDPNGHKSDTTGEFESGETFHIPNCVMWEVVYE